MGSSLNTIPVLTTATPIASASSYRKSITFFPHNVRGFFLNNHPPLSLTDGGLLVGAREPYYLRRRTHGDIVTKPWWSIASTADAQITVLEAFEDDTDRTPDKGSINVKRKLHGNLLAPILSTVSQPVLGPSPNRWSILFMPNTAGTVTLSILNPVVAGFGIMVFQNQTPIYLDYPTHGDIVQKAWYAICSAGTPALGIVECTTEGG